QEDVGEPAGARSHHRRGLDAPCHLLDRDPGCVVPPAAGGQAPDGSHRRGRRFRARARWRGGSAMTASNAPAVLRLDRVTKRYGSVVAVDALVLEIQQGEFFTLLGPSGSGKSTTLLLIAGFEQLSEGEIYLGDRPLSRVAAHKREIGVVFQSYALF